MLTPKPLLKELVPAINELTTWLRVMLGKFPLAFGTLGHIRVISDANSTLATVTTVTTVTSITNFSGYSNLQIHWNASDMAFADIFRSGVHTL